MIQAILFISIPKPLNPLSLNPKLKTSVELKTSVADDAMRAEKVHAVLALQSRFPAKEPRELEVGNLARKVAERLGSLCVT